MATGDGEKDDVDGWDDESAGSEVSRGLAYLSGVPKCRGPGLHGGQGEVESYRIPGHPGPCTWFPDPFVTSVGHRSPLPLPVSTSRDQPPLLGRRRFPNGNHEPPARNIGSKSPARRNIHPCAGNRAIPVDLRVRRKLESVPKLEIAQRAGIEGRAKAAAATASTSSADDVSGVFPRPQAERAGRRQRTGIATAKPAAAAAVAEGPHQQQIHPQRMRRREC